MDEISIHSDSSINCRTEKDNPPTLLLNLCNDMAKTIHEQVILVIGQLVQSHGIG